MIDIFIGFNVDSCVRL